MKAFRIAYDGRDYHGYQRQPDVPTVEGTLFDALRELGVLEGSAPRPPGYAAAGRTDAGVSAIAQTVTIAGPDWLSPAALNGALPADVRAWASATVPDSFHATHDAGSRTYTYDAYAPTDTVDDARIDGALESLSGTIAVDDLTRADAPERRTVRAASDRDGPFLRLSVTAGGFPREFVRRLVTLVLDVGRGDRPPGHVDRVLAPTSLPGHLGIGPAPPEPLVLEQVDYPGVSFRPNRSAVRSAVSVFEERFARRLAGARVAGRLGQGVGR